jgi:hypothetical protein
VGRGLLRKEGSTLETGVLSCVLEENEYGQ